MFKCTKCVGKKDRKEGRKEGREGGREERANVLSVVTNTET
jgi:hypothetical protein